MRNITLIIMLAAAVVSLAAAAPDMKTLIECSDQAWAEDVAIMEQFSFQRHVLRRVLDDNNATKSTTELKFQVTPTGGKRFDEQLYQLDGQTPTPREVDKNRKKEYFTRHYQQAETFELENPLGDNLALMPIFRDQAYRLVGTEEFQGVSCYRVEFDARPEPEKGDVREKLQYAVKGSALLTVEGCHLVSFEMETVRELKETPLTLKYLQLKLVCQPIADAWLIDTVDVHSNVSVLGVGMHKHNTITYSHYRPHKGS